MIIRLRDGDEIKGYQKQEKGKIYHKTWIGGPYRDIIPKKIACGVKSFYIPHTSIDRFTGIEIGGVKLFSGDDVEHYVMQNYIQKEEIYTTIDETTAAKVISTVSFKDGAYWLTPKEKVKVSYGDIKTKYATEIPLYYALNRYSDLKEDLPAADDEGFIEIDFLGMVHIDDINNLSSFKIIGIAASGDIKQGGEE